MKLTKLFAATAFALSLAACGGGSGGGDGDGGNGGGGGGGGGGDPVATVTHQHYSLDFGDYLKSQPVEIKHGEETGTLKLGSSNVSYRDNAKNETEFTGYRHLFVGDVDEEGEVVFNATTGGMVLCKEPADPAQTQTIWHAVLPATAQAVDNPTDVLKNKRFSLVMDCDSVSEVKYTFDEQGGMRASGYTDEGKNGDIDPDKVAKLFSEAGWTAAADEDDGDFYYNIWAKLYQEDGRYFFVMIDTAETGADGKPVSADTEKELIILVEDTSTPET